MLIFNFEEISQKIITKKVCFYDRVLVDLQMQIRHFLWHSDKLSTPAQDRQSLAKD